MALRKPEGVRGGRARSEKTRGGRKAGQRRGRGEEKKRVQAGAPYFVHPDSLRDKDRDGEVGGRGGAGRGLEVVAEDGNESFLEHRSEDGRHLLKVRSRDHEEGEGLAGRGRDLKGRQADFHAALSAASEAWGGRPEQRAVGIEVGGDEKHAVGCREAVDGKGEEPEGRVGVKEEIVEGDEVWI
eukprot:767577-Hanusia_phi.AAC.8